MELAEILFEGTRSKGCGVVQFAQVTEAETAIGKTVYVAFCRVEAYAVVHSQVPAIHVRWTALGCQVQRPMAHVYPERC